MKDHSVRGSSMDGAPSLQRTLSEPFAASAPAGDGGEAVGYISLETLAALSNPNGVGPVVAAAAYSTVIPVYTSPPAPAVEVREAKRLINERLEDLQTANALYGKDQRLSAPDKVARNDREISWLKDLRSYLSASPREMVQESDDGAPGLNWKLSDETKKQIAEIESNQRHAFANLNNIIAGCPSEPSPSSRSETAGEVGLNWQISREAKAQIEEIESNTRNALLNAHKIVAGQLPPSPDCSGCKPSGGEVQKSACIEGAVTAESANAKSGGAA